MSGARERSIAVAGALIVVAMIGAFVLFRAAAPESRPAAPPAPQNAPEAPPAPQPPASAAPPPDPSLEIEGPRLTGSDPQGHPLWELTAVELTVDRDSQVVTATRVAGRLFRDGAATMRFSAASATYSPRDRTIVLRQRVEAQTADGRRVTGERVEIRLRDDRLIVDGGVRLVQRDMIVRADRLESDLRLRKTRLSGRIVVTGTGP